MRVTLAWTDAPGSTTGAAYVNNLDLVVTVGGVAYKGNVFSGANSAAGGTADAKNNVENVFLPAGVSGPITVRVTATSLAGIGVPGAAGVVNQDFRPGRVEQHHESPAPPRTSELGTPTFSDATPATTTARSIRTRP